MAKVIEPTIDEWEGIIRDAGFPRIKARDYKGQFNLAFNKFQDEKQREKEEKKKKKVIESKNITEPYDTYGSEDIIEEEVA